MNLKLIAILGALTVVALLIWRFDKLTDERDEWQRSAKMWEADATVARNLANANAAAALAAEAATAAANEAAQRAREAEQAARAVTESSDNAASNAPTVPTNCPAVSPRVRAGLGVLREAEHAANDNRDTAAEAPGARNAADVPDAPPGADGKRAAGAQR